jgi:DNA polymerase IV
MRDKPDGLSLIPPEQAAAFVESLAIEKFYGVGAATATKMKALGIHTGADLKQWSAAELVARFGKVGQFYYQVARGQDDRPVNPNRIRKSIGVEQSFTEDLHDLTAMSAALKGLARQVKERLHRHQRYGYTLTLKVKYADYEQITRSRTVAQLLQDEDVISSLAQELLVRHLDTQRQVRLLGITISHLEEPSQTLSYVQLCLEFPIYSR